MPRFLDSLIFILTAVALTSGCSSPGNAAKETLGQWAEAESPAPGDVANSSPLGDFNADSAYNYLARQVAFGPRVPNSDEHKLTGDWLVAELNRHGGQVSQQKAILKAFDGTNLNARNIFARFPSKNPEKGKEAPILLLAHWDSRPWADKDPDPDKRNLPVDGANDGASGVAILLEIARQLSLNPVDKNIDILFVDAEDWGEDGDEDSWALGTKYFVENPPIKGYSPYAAILLDMVGGQGATFCREYFSERSAPHLAEAIWQTASKLGYGSFFLNRMGGAILDDHVQLIKAGIPAIDIIEYHSNDDTGFNDRWHTTSDNLEGISKETLQAVGSTLLNFLRN
ncbi:MAG: M28 family peptidase [Muribaculaceae bacterium]|nr:M28 family peptidase [Muribaculaceae bacterium]